MKKRNLLLMLLLALGLPWAANGQDLADYTMSTGTDATRWITLDNPSAALSGYHDDDASSIINLGLTFPFGNGSYSQFWVNSNGVFSFSSSTAGGSTTGQFTSSYYNSYQPKISGIARDLGTGDGGYVNYQLTGTEPNRIFVCEYAMGYTYGSGRTPDVTWQVQLHEADSKVVIIYGDTPSTTPSSYQSGLGQSGSDFWIMTPSDNTVTHQTASYATTSSGWHGAYRYYEFNRPVIAYPKPTNLQVTGTDHESASFSWTAPEQGPNTLTGYAYQYKKASDTDWPTSWTSGVNASATTLTIHGLEASTSYNFRFKALYGSNESDIVTAGFLHHRPSNSCWQQLERQF